MAVLTPLPTPPSTLRRRTTVTELYRLYEARDPADTQRMELIEGEIVFMMPPGPLHAGFTDETDDVIRRKVGGAFRVRCQHPIRINRHNEPQPDISVVKPRKDAYALSHPDPDDVMLIIEVSDTSLEFESQCETSDLCESEIAEHWVLDVNARELHVFLNPWQGDYTQHSTHSGDEEVVCTTISDLKVHLSELLPTGLRAVSASKAKFQLQTKNWLRIA